MCAIARFLEQGDITLHEQLYLIVPGMQLSHTPRSRDRWEHRSIFSLKHQERL